MATKTKLIYENVENDNSNTNNIDSMLYVTILRYQSPLVLRQTPKPKIIHGEQILVKIGATRLCHSDLHLINGDWKKNIPLRQDERLVLAEIVGADLLLIHQHMTNRR